MNSAFVGYEELSRSRRVLSTSAEVDNIPLDLLNSSYPTQPHSLIANYHSQARTRRSDCKPAGPHEAEESGYEIVRNCAGPCVEHETEAKRAAICISLNSLLFISSSNQLSLF